MAELILQLAEIGAADTAWAGGKGAQLGAMMQAGLPVPEGFCVSTEAFRRGMNEDLRAAIAAAYEGIGGGRVAVRSSATAEDLPTASFAGQQDTFLNVAGGAAVIDAVEACWRSLFTERAVAYRRDRNIPDDTVAMAVVVQRMVEAEAAGVLFTINPVSGAIDELVVEAACGLGDKVVSSQVTPDRYRLRRRAPHDVIEQDGDETSALLTPAVLAELARLGLTAERLLGRAADIEWALDRNRLWLLQARAVTAAAQELDVDFGNDWTREACRGKLIFWSNPNVRETMPYPHTAFSWSMWRQVMALAAQYLYKSEKAEFPDDFPFGFNVLEGRMYYNLNLMLGAYGRFIVPMTRFMDPQVADFTATAVRSGELRAIAVPARFRWRMFSSIPRVLYWMSRHSSPASAWRCLHDCQDEVTSFRRIDLNTLSDEAILAMARYFFGENLPRMFQALVAALVSFPAVGVLEHFLPKWGFHDAFARIIAGCGNPTMDTALALSDIAESAPASVRKLCLSLPVSEIPAALAQSFEGRLFLEQMQEFLRVHGHRAVREFDFSCPRWRDDPTFVYETLRNYLGHPEGEPSAREHYQRQLREREVLIANIEKALARRPLRRWLFRRSVRSLESRLPLREAFKFYGMIGWAHLRDMYLEVGRRMAERGLLAERDDFFFFGIDELEQIAEGKLDRKWVRLQVTERRRKFARQMRANPPLIVRSDGRPETSSEPSAGALRGTPVSWGTVRGPARVLLDPGDGAALNKGDILVAPFTDPGWTPLFLTVGGLVMEVGGILSHGAMVAREYGIPAVVGVKDATRLIRDGEIIEVNGSTGEVRRLAAEAKSATASS